MACSVEGPLICSIRRGNVPARTSPGHAAAAGTHVAKIGHWRLHHVTSLVRSPAICAAHKSVQPVAVIRRNRKSAAQLAVTARRGGRPDQGQDAVGDLGGEGDQGSRTDHARSGDDRVEHPLQVGVGRGPPPGRACLRRRLRCAPQAPQPLTRVPKAAQPWVSTLVRTIFEQPDPPRSMPGHAAGRRRARGQAAGRGRASGRGRDDILAFTAFTASSDRPRSSGDRLWAPDPDPLERAARARTAERDEDGDLLHLPQPCAGHVSA